MLRPASESDLDLISSWITSRRDCEFWAGPALRFPLARSTLAKDIGFSPETSFCLDEAGLVGFGQLTVKGSVRAHLSKIIVAPHQRRSGHGARLVMALVELAARQGFSAIGLNVQQDNLAAQALYRKLGFELAARPASVGPAPGADYRVRDLGVTSTAPPAGRFDTPREDR
jgi:ribosomal-protein-alanine N-acetyltransferase